MTQAETKQGTISFISPNNVTETGHSGDGYVRITVGENMNDLRRRKSARIQQKGNSSTEWNPDTILLSREIGIETDTNKMKIGDGITPWSLLPYCNSSASDEEIKRIKYYGDPDIIPSPENYFTVNETGEAITGLTEDGAIQTDLVIPYKINGKLITKISYKVNESGVAVGTAFGECTSLVNVIMPNSIANITEDLFINCTSLKSIQLSNSLKTIEIGMFSGCTLLDNVIIPNSITSIGGNAFLGCTSLKSIIIPDSVKYIYYAAFQGCTSLKTITIPNGVPSIGESVFENCTGLTDIYIPNSVTSIDTNYAFKGCTNLTIYCEQRSYAETFAKENNIPVVYTDVSDIASKEELERLKYYGDKDIVLSPEEYFTVNETGDGITGLTETGLQQTDIVIPYKMNGKLITELSYKTDESGVVCGTPFTDCTNLVNVIMPNSITYMVEDVFRGCTSLKSVKLSNSLTEIGYNAFSGCTSLDNVIIPNSVTTIDTFAFSGCTSLKSITIPDSVKTIRNVAFNGCTSLENIVIPNGITYIGESVFENCTSLKSIYIPKSVTSIDTTYAFKGCNNLTIYCEQGSYADTFAQSNNIPVKYTDIDPSKYLTKDNTTEYTPIADYNLATKKYVDDMINASSSGEATNVSTVKTCTGDELISITSPMVGSIRYVSIAGTDDNISITPGLYFYLGGWKKVAIEDTAIISNEFVSGGDSTSINN